MKKTILRVATLLVLACAVLYFWGDIKNVMASSLNGKSKKRKAKLEKQATEQQEPASPGVTVLNKWDMPGVLTEISGLAYINEERFACIQDEAGTIYIYNSASGKIEKEIPFGASGDYEGLALVNETAWVIRADGHLFEVDNINTVKPVVKEYSTPLTLEHNTEGLCYDKKNNRLLVAVKEGDANSGYKGIYAFDLATKKMVAEPVMKIDLSDQAFSGTSSKKNKDASLMPSGIAIHPVTNDIYITEGRKPKLLITGSDGQVKKLYQLDTKEFAQPEGITFKPNGELFISNEGPKQPGNILRVETAGE